MTPETKIILNNKKKLKAIYKANGIYHTAKLLGIGKNTVRRWLDRHGIKRSTNGKTVCSKPDRSFMNRRTSTSFIVDGYRFIKEPGKRERAEHRLVIERIIKRKLERKEVVHHINLDRLINTEENLFLCTDHKDHQKIHSSLNKVISNLIKEGIIVFDRENKQYSTLL